MEKNNLEIYNNEKLISKNFEYKKTLKNIYEIFELVASEHKEKTISVSLHFASWRKMKYLNYEHRRKDKTTDVLSFPHNDHLENSFYLGDVFINKDIIIEQSNEIGSDSATEIKFLFMHGLLHLVGYDHKNKEDEKIMVDKQKEIFKKLGIRND